MCVERVKKEEDSRAAVKRSEGEESGERKGVRANVYVNFSFCTRTHLHGSRACARLEKGELSCLICRGSVSVSSSVACLITAGLESVKRRNSFEKWCE